VQLAETQIDVRCSDVAELLPDLVSLWRESVGEPEICVAVLDGPVDLTHPCFAGACVSAKEITASADPNAGFATTHGTHIASIIFGQHGSPVRGIAPRCRGLIIPVFASRADGTIEPCSQLDLARAITWAVQAGAHVINISAGQLSPGGAPDDYLANAVKLCNESGVLIVAAAGNEGCECLHVPAALPAVLAVGAMDSSGVPLSSSNWGGPYQRQGILAPGQDIPGAVPGGRIAHRSGTSFSTPIVSGISALLLSIQLKARGRFDSKSVMKALLQSATQCIATHPGECDQYLVGRLNISGARRAIFTYGLGLVNSSDGSGLRIPFSSLPQNLSKSIESESAIMSDARTGIQANESGELPLGASSEFTPSTVSAAMPLEDATAVTSSCILSSDCGCGCGAEKCTCGGGSTKCSCGDSGKPSLVYALGELGYDFGTQARRDSFVQAGLANPHDATQLLTFLAANPAFASAVTWTLNQDTTPVYAIVPAGPFAAMHYEKLRDFLGSQLTGVERISVPGVVVGKIPLLNGQVVPNIVPELRGLYSWSTPALVEAVAGSKPKEKDKETVTAYQQKVSDVSNFLERVYYALRNLGIAPQERAVNYAATNAFQAERVFESALTTDFNRDGRPDNLKLDSITTEKSPICRPGSDCWDVKLTFFNPAMRFEQAKHVYRFTVDVSDVIPVTVGKVRHWDEY